jgi:toxin FitB
MIILDTNIISEMMKPEPQSNVVSWLDQQEVIHLYVTTISIAEIAYGLNALPDGKRRSSLAETFQETISLGFEGRIIDFDVDAAYLYGKIMANRRKIGRPLSMPDGQIVAIAIASGYSIATRNINDFIDCQVNVINPFI